MLLIMAGLFWSNKTELGVQSNKVFSCKKLFHLCQ